MGNGDVASAIDFLRNWEPKGIWVLSAIDPDAGAIIVASFRAEQEKEVAAWLARWNGKRNIYFQPNRVARLFTKKTEKGDLVAANVFHADVDPPKDIKTDEARLEWLDAKLPEIEDFNPTPSIVVYSGGGYQLFWLLKEPIALTGVEDVARVEAHNRWLEKALKGDHCFNVDRIMRLPGTVNIPNKKKREAGRTRVEARVLSANWQLRYDPISFGSIEDISAIAPSGAEGKSAAIPRTSLPEWLRRVVAHGSDPAGERDFGGDRSRAVFAVATELVRSGYTDAEIGRVLSDRDNGISSHIYDQSKPEAYALRQAAQAREKVGEGFTYSRGAIVVDQRNIRLALVKLGVELSYNEFNRKMMIDGPSEEPRRLLQDETIVYLYLLLDERFKLRPKKEFFYDVVTNEARKNPFHPVRSYLESLRWDGVERINNWLSAYMGAEDTPYIRAVGTLLLIAAVRRIRSPGSEFHEIVILVSPTQGIGKSNAVRALAVRKEWFTDSLPLDADDKQVIETLSGKWIVEAAELSGIRGKAIEHLKAFLGREIDRARLAWGRIEVEAPRQCVFIGTTNSTQFLFDSSGNRRFWPVLVGEIDVEAIVRDRDQLWAEASVREAAGESSRLDPSLYAAAGAAQDERVAVDPWVDLAENALENYSTGRIVCRDMWAVFSIPDGLKTPAHDTRLGETMRSLGWERAKARIEGKVKWCYLKGEPHERTRRIHVERDGLGQLTVYAIGEGEANPREWTGDEAIPFEE